MEITFLGTGSAIPIPRVQPDGTIHNCPQCRSTDWRDRRWPSSLLVDGSILIDAPPPIVTLLNTIGAKPEAISTVILTHRHSDAAGGLASLPKGIHRVFPAAAGTFKLGGHRFEAFKVPHDPRTWGYLINNQVAYFSDYADISPALAALKRASIAVLDGSGWESAFPTHQPMKTVLPILHRLPNLERIYFTHIGHSRLPHSTLEREMRRFKDDRFSLAYHGLKLNLR